MFLVGALLAAGTAVAEPTWYVVTDGDVQIRCGADSSYYSFATADEGDLVSVTGEKYNYARINAIGSVFDDAYGYVKYPASEEGRFTISDDGSTGQTLGATPILAPNLNTNDLAHSWRQLCILPRGENLRIIETWTAEKDGLHAVPHTVHRVELPGTAEGWVNMASLRPATETEVLSGTGSSNEPAAAPEVVVIETTDVVETGVAESLLMGERVENLRPMGRGPASFTADFEGDVIIPEGAVITGEATRTIVSVDEGSPLLMQWINLDEMDVVTVESREIEVVEVQETMLSIIEATYEGVALSDLDAEELKCLKDDFLLASEEEEDPIRARYAKMRADQIDVYNSLRGQDQAINELLVRIERSQGDAVDREIAIANTGDYEVIGLLSTSAVFDGTDRPMLYRIQDSSTNRTLAYVRPESSEMIGNMVGQHIGVMGRIAYDPVLQVNIVETARVDLMATNTALVPVD